MSNYFVLIIENGTRIPLMTGKTENEKDGLLNDDHIFEIKKQYTPDRALKLHSEI